MRYAITDDLAYLVDGKEEDDAVDAQEGRASLLVCDEGGDVAHEQVNKGLTERSLKTRLYELRFKRTTKLRKSLQFIGFLELIWSDPKEFCEKPECYYEFVKKLIRQKIDYRFLLRLQKGAIRSKIFLFSIQIKKVSEYFVLIQLLAKLCSFMPLLLLAQLFKSIEYRFFKFHKHFLQVACFDLICKSG